jgi:ABC-type sulfate transport system permease subunit
MIQLLKAMVKAWMSFQKKILLLSAFSVPFQVAEVFHGLLFLP